MAEDSTPNSVGELEGFVRQRFDKLGEAELRLLRALPTGETAFCGPAAGAEGNDPRKANEWGSEREIRAGLICWLCVNSEAVKKIDPGGIQVYGAKIIGRLNLFFAPMNFPLLFQFCRFDQDIDLKFATLPALNLAGSSIRSLILSGTRVRGDVTLEGLTCLGQVLALQAEIGGSLDCRGATLSTLNGVALAADRADIQGSVLLDQGFSADGDVRLAAAQVGVQLVCNSGTFRTLNLQGATIKDSFLWRDVRNANTTRLDLTNASVGAILDDEASWPEKGNLFLDGFVYHRFVNSPTDSRERLGWLDRQREFKPQPYLQLAKFLRDMGDDRGARRVLFEMEDRWRKAQDRKWYQRCLNQVLRKTIGYGLMSWWAMAWLLGLMFVGFVLFGCGYFGGAIVPTERQAYEDFESRGKAPPYYPQFDALAFSFEHTFPLVSLGVKDHWAPKPGPPGVVPEMQSVVLRSASDLQLSGHYLFRIGASQFLRYWLWFQTLVGWVLATLFVGGLTGIVRTGK